MTCSSQRQPCWYITFPRIRYINCKKCCLRRQFVLFSHSLTLNIKCDLITHDSQFSEYWELSVHRQRIENGKPTMDKYAVELSSIIPRRFKLQTLFTITQRRIRRDPSPTLLHWNTRSARLSFTFTATCCLSLFSSNGGLLSRCWRFGFLFGSRFEKKFINFFLFFIQRNEKLNNLATFLRELFMTIFHPLPLQSEVSKFL